MNGELSKLYGAVEAGCVLHGSPKQLTLLLPHKANDLNKRSGNQRAVYATKSVLVAVLCALVRPKGGPPWRWGWSGSSKELKAWGENVELGNGYVYALHPTTFQVVCTDDGEESNEYASPVAVEPVEAVEVTPQFLSVLNITLDLQ